MKKNVLLKGTLLIIGSVFILLSFFSHPVLDDFSFAEGTLRLGFIKAQIFWYNNLTARYFPSAILSLYTIITSSFGIFFECYKIMPIFHFVLFFLSMYFFIKSLVSDKLSDKEIFWGAFIFFIIYITRMPSTSQVFYWFAGAVTYLLGNIMFSFFAVFIIKLS